MRSACVMVLAFVALMLFVTAAAMAAEATSAPAKTPAAKPAATPAEKPAPPATLDECLKLMQKTLEKATTEARGKIPASIQDLALYLPNGAKDMANPETGKPVVMNAAMAGQQENMIPEPEKFITFYADADTKDKGRAVIYASGTVKYLKAKDFQQQLTESKPRRPSLEDRLAGRDAFEARMMERQAARAEAAEKAREAQRKARTGGGNGN